MKRSLILIIPVAALLIAACGRKDPQDHVRRGSEYLNQKKYQEAILEFRAALQIDPKLADTRLKLAEAYTAVGDGSNALQESVRAADLLPDRPDVQIKAAKWLLAASSFEDAGARADRVLAKDPKNSEALIIKGSALAGLGSFDSAVTKFESAALSGAADQSYIGIGTVELARGRQAFAERAFVNAANANPKSVAPRIALANLYLNMRNLDAAERELQAARQIEPGNIIVNRALGLIYVWTNRAAQAEPYLVAVADSDNSAAGKMTLANYYISLKKYGDARKVLQRSAMTATGYADATARLAGLDLVEGKKDDARKKIDEVLSKSPKHANSLVLKAQMLADESKYDSALSILKPVLGSERSDVGAHLLAGTIYQSIGRLEDAIQSYQSVLKNDGASLVQKVETNVQLATIHLSMGMLDKAMTYAQSALTVQPRRPDIHLLVARIDTAAGRLDEARRRLAGLEKSYPESAAVQVLRGQLELASKHPDAAATAFGKALQQEPSNLDALSGLTRVETGGGKSKEAVARIERAIQSGTPSVDLLMLAARVYAGAADAKKAEDALHAALQRDPGRFDAYTLLGQLYSTQHRLPEAIKQFETILARDPKSVAANTAVGVLWQFQGQNAEAEKAYERTIALDSRAAVASNNLAWLFVDSGRNLDRALELAQTAHQQMPENPDVADTLGWIFVKKQLAASAIPLLESGAKVKSNDPVIHYHLGMAYKLAGRSVNARRSLSRALELSGNFPGSDEARKAMATLNGT